MIRVAFVIGGYPPEEHKRRADVALSYSTQEIQVGIVDVAASPYFYGMTPRKFSWWRRHLLRASNARRKKVTTPWYPSARWIWELTEESPLVDIPVIGPTEAALHVASAPWVTGLVGLFTTRASVVFARYRASLRHGASRR